MNGKARSLGSLVLVLILGFFTAGPLLAFEDEKPETVIAGAIKSVDAEAKSFVLTVKDGEDGKDVTLKVDDKTKYWLDGKEATLDEALKAGATARVAHTDGLATKVDVKSS